MKIRNGDKILELTAEEMAVMPDRVGELIEWAKWEGAGVPARIEVGVPTPPPCSIPVHRVQKSGEHTVFADRETAEQYAKDHIIPTPDEQLQAPTPTPTPDEVSVPQPIATVLPLQTAGQVTPAPTPTPAAGLELDAEGMPWDSRIHSSGKTKMISGKDIGNWKPKRGVPPQMLAKVKAELANPIPASVALEQSMVPPPPAPVVPGPAATVPIAFPELMQRMVAKALDRDQMQALATKYGLESIAYAAANPEACNAIAHDESLQ